MIVTVKGSKEGQLIQIETNELTDLRLRDNVLIAYMIKGDVHHLDASEFERLHNIINAPRH